MPSQPALDHDIGTDAATPLSFRRRDAGQIAHRIWLLWGFHNLSLLAAGVAFFCFLAVTPMIAAIVLIYGLVADVSTVEQQVAALTRVIPPDAASVLEGQLLQVVTTSSTTTGIGLVVAILFSVYGAMYAVNGLIAALNVINSELETRSLVSLTRRAVALTLAAMMIGLTGLVSGGLFAWLTNLASPLFGPSADVMIKIIASLAVLALGTAGFALIMRYGPDRRVAKWRWLTPGAITATLLWMAASFGFSLYVSYISNYSATYGSLSAMVVFLIWLYLSAYGILIGALLNAELERQTLADSTRGPDRPLGERGAVLADTRTNYSLMTESQCVGSNCAMLPKIKALPLTEIHRELGRGSTDDLCECSTNLPVVGGCHLGTYRVEKIAGRAPTAPHSSRAAWKDSLLLRQGGCRF